MLVKRKYADRVTANPVAHVKKAGHPFRLTGISDTLAPAQWPLPYSGKPKKVDVALLAKGREKKHPAKISNLTSLDAESAAPGRSSNDIFEDENNGREELRQAPKGASTDSMSIYLNSIRKYRLLTPKDEKDLARGIARGDLYARKTMIEGNLRLVVNIARRYINRGLPMQDLIEEGNVGLIKAVERFKAAKGCKFSTYATYWIKQSVERAIGNQVNTIRLPIHISADIAKISKASRKLTMLLSREPNTTELSEKTGLSGRYVKKLSGISKKSLSLESSMPDGTEQSFLDRLADSAYPCALELINEARRKEKVKDWLNMLDNNERDVIRLRFGLDDDEPQTLETIGESFGVTRERVRQIEVKVLCKLKEIMAKSGITSFGAL